MPARPAGRSPGRPGNRALLAAAAVAVAVLAGLAAAVFVIIREHSTSTTASVRVVPPTARTAAAGCARLHAGLPQRLNGLPARRTEPRSDATAAWGDPAIVLRCGVGRPAAYRPTAQLFTVNGVDWLPENRAEAYVFTTVGRRPAVELAVPHRYAPEINPLADLSRAVAALVPSAGPSGAATPS